MFKETNDKTYKKLFENWLLSPLNRWSFLDGVLYFPKNDVLGRLRYYLLY